MTYVAVVGVLLIFVLAVVVGIVEARTSAYWRRVAAEGLPPGRRNTCPSRSAASRHAGAQPRTA